MSSGSEVESDPDIPSSSVKKRKTLYAQKYKPEWDKEMKWLKPSNKGHSYGWCKPCRRCDIKVTHGKADVIRHSETQKHVQAALAIVKQRTISDVFNVQSKEKDLEQKAKEGVIRIAGFIAEHNLPFKLMEHFPALLKSICSDSLVAKKIVCGRTKSRSIIVDVTGATQRENIVQMLKTYKFSIIADESTDRSCIKHLCLVARINIANNNIKDTFLTLIPIGDATGAALFDHIITFFNKYAIPYRNNCIGFASDGANNMMGLHNSVASRMREAVPHIFIMKCICHSFHLCASNACEKLPQDVEQFCREVYNYFSNSPKRTGELKEFQEFVNVSPVKILHPALTRWLSLEMVVKRLLSQFSALLLYFTDQSQQNIISANVILNLLLKPEIKLYLQFLAFILPTFNTLNIIMQSEAPKIHILYSEVTTAVKTIMDYYIKDEIIRKTNVYDIDFKNPRHFLPIDKMYFGAEIMNSKLDNHVLHGVKARCLDFYIESIRQILFRFPLKNSVFTKLEFINPKNVISRKLQSISEISLSFPNLISDIQVIDNEWRLLRNIDFNELDINMNDLETINVIDFWQKISKIKLGNGQVKFDNLTKLVFNLLCLPHSSANVERIFSQINLNKTQMRNRLNTDTLEGLLHTKGLVSSSGQCHNFKITPEVMKKINTPYYYKEKTDQNMETETDTD